MLAWPAVKFVDTYWQKHRLDLVASAASYGANISNDLKLFQNSVQSNQSLAKENSILRAEVAYLQAKLNRIQSDVEENQALKELLGSSSRLDGSFVSAKIISWLAQDQQTALIDKGSADMVFLGQAVLDGYGVFGQVIELGLHSSKIKLVTKPDMALQVQNQHNLKSFAHGADGALVIEKLPASTIVAKGQQILASGIAGIYPAGYPYGVVTNIIMDGNGNKVVRLKPSAHLKQSNRVLLFWQDQPVRPPYRR